MPDPSLFVVFVAAALALLVVPGPAVLYIVARSVDQGRTAGLVSTLGIHVGSLVHVAAAAIGLSSLLVSSATAFNVVKYAGAAYLVLLGLRRLLARDEAASPSVDRRRRLSRIFAQGIVVNVLNPKTALFFFAFLPQFVDVNAPVATQIVVLGLTFILLGLVSDSLWAILAGAIGGWLRGNARFLKLQRYLSGGIFVGLGVTTALAGSKAK